MTVRKAIRKHCVSCVGGSNSDVHTCGGESVTVFRDENGACKFFPYRLSTGRARVKLVREFCLVCMGDQSSFVKECQEKKCAFHRYRMGKTGHKKNLTEEQRRDLADRMLSARLSYVEKG